MKVSAIINTIQTYNNYQQKIRDLKKQWVENDAYDDDYGNKQVEKEIDKVQSELGQFLDTEI